MGIGCRWRGGRIGIGWKIVISLLHLLFPDLVPGSLFELEPWVALSVLAGYLAVAMGCGVALVRIWLED